MYGMKVCIPGMLHPRRSHRKRGGIKCNKKIEKREREREKDKSNPQVSDDNTGVKNHRGITQRAGRDKCNRETG